MSSAEIKKSAVDSQKDRRLGLSCAECRRSKLKCDRVFPCQSCVRRGCASICPDGTQTATKGNKALMAYAQRMSDQVKTMSARIQQLEQALQTQTSGEHPLLAGRDSHGAVELETIYDTGLKDVSDAIGSLSIGMNGRAKYHGETAGSEYFQALLAPPDDAEWRPRDQTDLGLPAEIVELVNSFPFGLRDCPYTQMYFMPFLPERERALELVDLYYEHMAWMYDPIPRLDFMNTIFNPIYGSTGFTSLYGVHSHRLSVFFILLASGTTFETHSSASMLAEQYHSLARGAFALDSILQEATCAAVQALFMMMRFLYSSDRASSETRWLLNGLCTRVAQTIGLQRDSAGWNLNEEEVQRRRIMFWELYTYDSWGSIVNGRPPSLNIHHTDCRFPEDLEPVIQPGGTSELGWHAWKYRYSASCLSISVQHVFSIKVPVYAALQELDRKIRTFPLPLHMQSPVQANEIGRSWSSDPVKAMQQYCVLCERESNLLYIHRSFFAQAIREKSRDPLQHKFAPSVLATYRSACRMISSLNGLYAIHPKRTSQVWFFWSGIFSSCIVLGALVVESPGCTLAQSAMNELDQALTLYREGSAPCRPPPTLTVLQKLQQRACAALTAHLSGLSDTAPLSVQRTGEKLDELEVLGGRKSVITKSPSNSPHSSSDATSSSPRSLESSEARDDSSKGTSPSVLVQPSAMDYYDAGQDYDMSKAYNAGYPSFAVQVPQPSNLTYAPQLAAVHYDYVQQSQYAQPSEPVSSHQQSSGAFGFVTQEEIWRNFMAGLDIQAS